MVVTQYGEQLSSLIFGESPTPPDPLIFISISEAVIYLVYGIRGLSKSLFGCRPFILSGLASGQFFDIIFGQIPFYPSQALISLKHLI